MFKPAHKIRDGVCKSPSGAITAKRNWYSVIPLAATSRAMTGSKPTAGFRDLLQWPSCSTLAHTGYAPAAGRRQGRKESSSGSLSRMPAGGNAPPASFNQYLKDQIQTLSYITRRSTTATHGTFDDFDGGLRPGL